MKASLALSIETQVLESVRADLAVATFFAGDRPLRGDAGRADWRLLGLLSALLREGRLHGEPGEVMLVPTLGRLRAPRLLLLGLGARADLGYPQIEAATRDAILRGVALRCGRLALSAPGGADPALPPARTGEAVLRGAVAALHERPAHLELVLVARDEAVATLSGLARAATRADLPVRLQNPEAVEAGDALAVRLRHGQSAVQDGP
ncbi:MAG: hypothetical protein JSU66_12020 [Deltaproteobacteria bacterium]|nr:MAG: hypothetical protein JSU66_12020 [Deltaproteobacteria bacterium]